MEMTVVMATVALLTVLSLPATRTFLTSLGSSDGETRCLIGSALATARAIAAKEQRYAGIRFQYAYHPEGPLKADQYIIFIVNEEPANMGGLTVGFRAIKGIKPIKLPSNIGVMDLKLGTLLTPQGYETPILSDADITPLQPAMLTDTTSFAIVFSPAGKLFIHDVRVRNRDGYPDTISNKQVSTDDVFNKLKQVDARFRGLNLYSVPIPGAGMFVQDDWGAPLGVPYLGLGKEKSRNSFIIYDRQQFEQAYSAGVAWSGYLYKLADKMIYINPYTGTIVNSR
jgi:hypothetical protein